VLVHQNLPSNPEALLAVVAPYRDDLVAAAEWIFAWYWLADLCAAEGAYSESAVLPLPRAWRQRTIEVDAMKRLVRGNG
jgi:hypothetical protein